jgi:hypothetical protein
MRHVRNRSRSVIAGSVVTGELVGCLGCMNIISIPPYLSMEHERGELERD